MPATTTLPIMAGLAILGAAAGVNLGRSAISEINPAYFTEPDTRFHADLSPYRSPDWAQLQAAEYRAAQQPVPVGDLGSGCIGCRDYPVEYVPRHDPAMDGYQDGRSASAAEPVLATVVEPPAPDPHRERIQLYASYPLTEEEVQAVPPRPEEAQTSGLAGAE